MKKKLLILFCVVIGTFAYAQSANSNYIAGALASRRSCKGGALTDNQGYVVLFGGNGFSCSGIPADLSKKLEYKNNLERNIDDVCLTEQGRWVLIGDHIWWSNIPDSLANEINEFVSWGDRIKCVVLNDYGDWMIVSDKHMLGSSQQLTDHLVDCRDKMGTIRTVSLTNSGYIIVADNGFARHGYVPDVVWNQLNSVGFEVNFARFTENGSYLLSDGASAYSGYLY